MKMYFVVDTVTSKIVKRKATTCPGYDHVGYAKGKATLFNKEYGIQNRFVVQETDIILRPLAE